ncbi:hypothetical protein HWV62_35975 [Athelia sp. TMB]|nr:hypothetical protein HWV62_35975 [Athelia sp. TMB]
MVGMLACKFDVRIEFNKPLTFLSAIFAILFTFAASLSNDYWKMIYLRRWTRWIIDCMESTFGMNWGSHGGFGDYEVLSGVPHERESILLQESHRRSSSAPLRGPPGDPLDSPEMIERASYDFDPDGNLVPDPSGSGWMAWMKKQYAQITVFHFIRAVILAAAIDTMFYIAMFAMEINEGRVEWHFVRIVESYLVTLFLCMGACLAMVDMELHIGRQMATATLSAASVCSMHYFDFKGMEATTMWTRAPVEPGTGFPEYLTWTIIGGSILVCIVANALLANRAIFARRRMAETIRTKRSLWRIIAEKEAAERAHELKQHFISVASHEIRTPLHTRMFLSYIQQACHTVNLIAENVLDFSKLERDNTESAAHPVVVEPRTLLDGIARQAAAAESRPDHRTVDTIISVSPRVPSALLLDETYTLRLYSNAAKFTESGFVSLALDMDAQGRHLVITVRDTGIGIPITLREAVFEPFRQADSSLTRAHYGAGLGLSIVKHLVHRMDGTITVDSVLGGGSTFVVTLPTQAAEPPIAISSSIHPASSTKKRRLKVMCSDARAERLYVDLWNQFGCEARAVSPHTSCEELWRDTDVLWVDSRSVQISAGLSTLLAGLSADMHSNKAVPKRPLLCIAYSVTEDLLTLGAGIKAERVYLVRQPVAMHAVLAFLDSSDLSLEAATKPSLAAVETPVTLVKPPNSPVPKFTPAPLPYSTLGSLKPKVLLVEDNLINQRLGKRLVEKLGYEVTTANNGQEAVQIASQGGYGICLMDLQMPIMDGFAATSRIRELERDGIFHGRMWIIALSANVTHESSEKGRAAGMDNFLPKPLRLDALQTALEHA